MNMNDPHTMIRPRRKITGMSAILLPMRNQREIDWAGFESHTRRTLDAGLTPAINMDTGFANLIDESVREEALRRTASVASGRPFLGGVFVGDSPDTAFSTDAYAQGIDQIQHHGGTPIVFQSFGLTSGDDDAIFTRYEQLASRCDRFYAFELGQMFAPFGRIYSIELYERLLGLDACVGAKHSSLRRDLEWQRLQLRDRVRPSFQVLTGNDLAIDMVIYGSDYLLGLSTFCPDVFARRDALWAAGDPAFYQLNDWLQYLGMLAFRPPVPAYKHSAAMYLHAQNRIASDHTFPGSPTRPASDSPLLQHIADQLGELMNSDSV